MLQLCDHRSVKSSKMRLIIRSNYGTVKEIGSLEAFGSSGVRRYDSSAQKTINLIRGLK
jgi:hypothetical protein